MIYFLLLITGTLAGLTGIAINYASEKGVKPVQLLIPLSFCGTVLFAVMGRNEWAEFSCLAVLFGVLSGITQYLPIKLLKKTLELGPLSPAWCVFSLGSFVPVILYSAIALGETLTLCQCFSLAATLVVVIFASLRGNSNAKADPVKNLFLYGLLLLLIFFSTGLLNILLKAGTVMMMPSGKTLIESQKCVIMAFAYFAMLSSAVAELLITKEWNFSPAFWIGTGVQTVSSLTAYAVYICFIRVSALLLFAMPCTVSILVAAILSTVFFKEKRTWQWYVMVLCAVIAVLLNR